MHTLVTIGSANNQFNGPTFPIYPMDDKEIIMHTLYSYNLTLPDKTLRLGKHFVNDIEMIMHICCFGKLQVIKGTEN